MNEGESVRSFTWQALRILMTGLVAILMVGLVVIMAAIIAALGYQLFATSSWTASSAIVAAPIPPRPRGTLNRDQVGAVNFVVPERAPVFDDTYSAAANLNPAHAGTFRRAATDSAPGGVEFALNSGWRFPKYREDFILKATVHLRSGEEAVHWVDTPDASTRVAEKVGNVMLPNAVTWTSEHCAKHEIRQICHGDFQQFELRLAAVDHGCSPTYADPTRDPRMQP